MPSCSSDLFLGNATTRDQGTGLYFQGARIAAAILAELQTRQYLPGGPAGPLSQADDVVLAGGPGVVALSRTVLAGVLPVRARTSTICDACVVPSTVVPLAQGACSTWQDCPPQEGWKRGLRLWHPAHALQVAALLSPALLQAAQSPLLVYMPQVSSDLLAAFGAWPIAGNATRRSYALSVAQALRLQGQHVAVSFVPPCTGAGPSLLHHDLYYFQLANCTNGYNFSFGWAVTQAVQVVVGDHGASEGGFLHCTPPVNASTLQPCAS